MFAINFFEFPKFHGLPLSVTESLFLQITLKRGLYLRLLSLGALAGH